MSSPLLWHVNSPNVPAKDGQRVLTIKCLDGKSCILWSLNIRPVLEQLAADDSCWTLNCGRIGFQGQRTLCGSEAISWWTTFVKHFKVDWLWKLTPNSKLETPQQSSNCGAGKNGIQAVSCDLIGEDRKEGHFLSNAFNFLAGNILWLLLFAICD